MGQDLITCPPDRVAPRGNPFQRRRFASQTKPIQECHPERSEGSLSGERSFAALRMTKRDGLFFEMDCAFCLYPLFKIRKHKRLAAQFVNAAGRMSHSLS